MQNRAFAIQDTTSTGLQRYIQASKYSFRNLPCSQFPWDSFESSISVHGQPNYAYFEPKSPFAATSSKVRFRHASSYLVCRRVHRFRQGGKWCPSDDFLNGVPESPFYSIEHFFFGITAGDIDREAVVVARFCLETRATWGALYA